MKPTDVPRLTDDPLIHLSESQSARVPTAPVASPAIRGERLDGPPRKRSASPAPLSAAYERLGRSVALLGALAVALGLWIAGAFFTLQFLARMGVPLTGLGSLQWLIPVAISAAELFFWPQRGSRALQGLMFLAVLTFDVGTTYAGIVELGAGRVIPLFAGIHLPAGGVGLAGLGVGCGLLFAFGPEKIGRWAVADLCTLWRNGAWT